MVLCFSEDFLIVVEKYKSRLYNVTNGLQIRMTFVKYIILIDFQEKQMNTQILQAYFASLLDLSAQKTIELQEFHQKNWRQCLSRFTLHIVNNLEFDQNLTVIGLLIAKRAVDHNLKASKKIIHKLLIVSFLIAQKMYEEDCHTLESFSLVSGVTIRELVQLEARILHLMDFHTFIGQQEILKLKAGKVEELFQNSNQQTTPQDN